MKFILKNQLMYKLIDTKLTYLLNQQEIQNTVKLSSFDTNGNYVLSLKNISEYYFEKLIQNNNFKAILNNFDICIKNFKFIGLPIQITYFFYLLFIKSTVLFRKKQAPHFFEKSRQKTFELSK